MNVADRVESLRREGWEKIQQNRPDEALPFFDEALGLCEDDASNELIRIYKAFALVALDRTDGEVADLPSIVFRRRSPRHLFLAAYTLMYRFRLAQEFERASFYGRVALEAAEKVEGENWRPLILTELGNVAVFDSRFAEAIELYEEALTLLGNDEKGAYRAAFVVQNLGYSKLLVDETATGIALIHQAIDAMKQHGAEGFVAESYIDLCLGYLDLGDLESALHYGEAGLEIATEHRQIRNAHYLLGEVCHRTGDIAAATSHFQHLATFYPDFPHLTDLLLAIDLRKMVNLKLS